MRTVFRAALALTLFGSISSLLLTDLSLTAALAQADKAPAESVKPAPNEATKPAPPRPGKDRWSIKTGADADAKDISRTPVKSTIEKLLALPRPVDMPMDGSNAFFQEHRARPAETTVWNVEADVIECRKMPDGDYRVVVRGATGKTMVLEMPDPAPAFVDPQSRFAADIKKARGQFDSKVQPERTAKLLTGHARITGVGFFGRVYGDKKPDGNLIQIHPVLQVEWLDKPTTEFTAPQDTLADTTGKPAPKPAGKPTKPAKPAKKQSGKPGNSSS